MSLSSPTPPRRIPRAELDQDSGGTDLEGRKASGAEAAAASVVRLDERFCTEISGQRGALRAAGFNAAKEAVQASPTRRCWLTSSSLPVGRGSEKLGQYQSTEAGEGSTWVFADHIPDLS